jgi:monoamine oxidase
VDEGVVLYWKVGQYQRFAGMEGRRQGNCLSQASHVDRLQGYLNGAVDTGQRVAGESRRI